MSSKHGGMVAALWSLVVAGGVINSEALLVTSAREPREPEVLEVDPYEEDGLGYDGDGAEDHALDWQISEIVQELHPMEVPPVRSVATWYDAPISFASNRTQDIPEGMRWHYGTHHKAGTVMLAGLASNQVDFLDQPYCFSKGKYGFEPKGCRKSLKDTAKLWFWCNLSQPLVESIGRGNYNFGTNYRALRSNELAPPGMARGVHVIRDPLAMVVSGYIYHRKSDDTPRVLAPTRNMSRRDALAAEASFVLEKHGKDMLRTYQNAPPWLLQVRFESFTASSERFDTTAEVLYQHMLGGVLPPWQVMELVKRSWKFDLRRSNPKENEKQIEHVASAAQKEEVMQALNDIPADLLKQLKEMRGPLGYGQPRPEAAE